MARHRIGQELQHRERRHRLARARFAHQRHRLAAGDGEAHALHRLDRVGAGAEGDREVADLEQGRLAHASTLRGFKASRTASPMNTSSAIIAAITMKPVKASHGALRLFLPWSKQLAQRRRTRRQAVAQEVERGQGGHGAGQDEGQVGEGGGHGVGQDVPHHDARVQHAERAGGADIVEIAPAQEFRPHVAHQRGPAEQQHDGEQDPEAGLHQARQDDQEIERRQARPDLEEALEGKVDPAAEIALHRAGGDADDRAQDGEAEAEQHGDAKAVDHPRQHVARLVVGAERMFQRRRQERQRRRCSPLARVS